jgi:hypothetical protein
MTKLKIGDVVLCQGQPRRVVKLYKNIDGGVSLDEPVGDFHSWNEDDLIFVRHADPEWLRVHAHLLVRET